MNIETTKIRLQIIWLLFLLVSGSIGLMGQQPSFRSDYWENQASANQERQYFDPTLPSFSALRRSVLYEYFPTNSGLSGERFHKYLKLQYADEAAAQEWGRIPIVIPQHAKLEQLDLRIWQNGLILYEAKAKALVGLLSDSLLDWDGGLLSLTLKLPELGPQSVVELYYQCSGVPLPHEVFFQEDFPVLNSKLSFKILSAYPLRFFPVDHGHAIAIDSNRRYNFLNYSFSTGALPAKKYCTNALGGANDQPRLLVEWLDMVFPYDRDKTQQWSEVAPLLFYRGRVRNYDVFTNTMATELSLRHYFAGLESPISRFHTRANELRTNQNNRFGYAQLDQRWADEWVALEELSLDLARQPELSFDYAFRQLQQQLKKSIDRISTADPELFLPLRDQALFLSYLLRFLDQRETPYWLALYKAPYHGPIIDSFISVKQFDAMGIVLADARGKPALPLIASPYLGQYWAPGEIPANLQGGELLLMHWDSLDTQILKVGSPEEFSAGFNFKQQLNLRWRYGRGQWRQSYHWKREFKDPLFHQLWQSDSIRYWGETSPYYAFNHQIKQSDSLSDERSIRFDSKDTLRLALELNKVWPLQLDTARDCALALLAAVELPISFVIHSDRAFDYQFEPQSYSYGPESAFQFEWSAEQLDRKSLEIKGVLKIRARIFADEDLIGYLHFQDFINRPQILEVWQK
jgi:hypothetical protein